MRTFDLDSFEIERPRWISFLGMIAPVSFWQLFLSPEGYWDSRTRQQEVHDALISKFGFGIEQVRRDATAFLRRNYSHVCFYHGTRIFEEESYRKSGLCCSSIKALNERARQMFGDIELLHRAISALQISGYAKHNNGKLGVWYSRRALLVNGSYCFQGSEYLNLLS